VTFLESQSGIENGMWRMKFLVLRVLVSLNNNFKKASHAGGRLIARAKLILYPHTPISRIHKAALVGVAFPTVFLLILLAFVFGQTPGTEQLKKIRNPLASEVYTADSVLIGRYFIQDRTHVRFRDISPVIVNALISTEDVRFFEHGGVDYVSLGRVVLKSILLQDESSGGGSTITQQLAKNLFPRKKYWAMSMLVNKLREAVIAKRLERIYSKEEILTLYLNTIPFGDNTYGIQAASLRFFSTDARNITLEEAAVLIGMLKATNSYNPRLYPHRSLKRRNVVLAQMKKYQFIGVEQKEAAQKKPLELRYKPTVHREEVAPYFREFLKQELEKWCEQNRKPDGEPYDLYTDGLKIYTTIDSRLQQYAEQAVAKQMGEIQKTFFDHWGNEDPWTGKDWIVTEALRRTSRYKALLEQGMQESEIIKELSKPVSTKIFSWNGTEQAIISPLDSVKHHLQFLNAGFLAIEASTGAVKAWVGGIDHDFFQYDHVKKSTKRQVGSVFKPIVFASAVEQGLSPCELISAGQETYFDEEGVEWRPRNSQYDYPVDYSMRGALAYSVNTVSVKLIQKSGVENTIAMAQKMGISSEMPHVPSIALGSSAISLMEMTAAYATFANEGVSVFPFFITEIRDRDGNVYNKFRTGSSRVMSKDTALKIRSMLQTVVQEGTASRLRWKYGVYCDVAGKTGTTQSNADGWFMSMTPGLVMGSWVGADDPRIRFRDTNLGQGSNTALPITAYFLKNLSGDETFANITEAKFPNLPSAIRREMNCDLYEMNDNLWVSLEKKVQERDSIMLADTLAKPPAETFLETLYKRKRRILMATQQANETRALLTGKDRGL
jgi:penicillin-binding protein 1A